MTIDDPFPALIAPILALEGGFSNDPDDAGGQTNFGITLAVARAAGFQGPMEALTITEAAAIYRARYWEAPHFDKVHTFAPQLAGYLLNEGINMGPELVVRFLQRALNMLNFTSLGADLVVDGDCGPVTLAALRDIGITRSAAGYAVLLGVVQALVVGRYVEIAESNVSQRKFAYGWLRRGLDIA
jgi:lysozyme family protein